MPNWPRGSTRDTVGALSLSLQYFLSFYAWQRPSKYHHINPVPCQHLRKCLCQSLCPVKISKGAGLLPMGGFLAGHVSCRVYQPWWGAVAMTSCSLPYLVQPQNPPQALRSHFNISTFSLCVNGDPESRGGWLHTRGWRKERS